MPNFPTKRRALPQQDQTSSANQKHEREQPLRRPSAPSILASDPQAILALQRTLGNRAVGRLLAQRRAGVRGPAIQRVLAQGVTYQALQAEVGKNKTLGGNVSQAVHNNSPSTTLGALYLVVGFKNNYTELQPVNPTGNAFFVPSGNAVHDGQYYQRADIPTLANGGTDLMTSVATVAGDPYNGQPPGAQDVTQGNVGNCWLMAPMMAMAGSARWRARLANAVAPNHANYDVQIGVPNPFTLPGQALANQTVNVSGQLPAFPSADTHRDELLYAQMNLGIPGQIGGGVASWPALIEKAIAKGWGNNSYQSLDDNDASLGFELLGAAKPFTLQPPNPATPQYTALIQQIALGGAATATTVLNGANGRTLSTTDDDPMEIAAADYHLIEDHVYIITAATAHALTLRNPHGNNPPSAPIPTNDVGTLIARIDYLP